VLILRSQVRYRGEVCLQGNADVLKGIQRNMFHPQTCLETSGSHNNKKYCKIKYIILPLVSYFSDLLYSFFHAKCHVLEYRTSRFLAKFCD
jgi:hypothetical protein